MSSIIPDIVISRLPVYLRALDRLAQEGHDPGQREEALAEDRDRHVRPPSPDLQVRRGGAIGHAGIPFTNAPFP